MVGRQDLNLNVEVFNAENDHAAFNINDLRTMVIRTKQALRNLRESLVVESRQKKKKKMLLVLIFYFTQCTRPMSRNKNILHLSLKEKGTDQVSEFTN